ncbi:MAG: hypothetical protein K1X72_26455 [Pyrinomonadaceae bacterium]|nr:hypothetical protein [Pyrinomonadaceae bacterium]
MTTKNRLMTALFRDGSDAEKAYRELLNRNFSQNEISFVTSDTTRNKYFIAEKSTTEKAAEGTGIGAAVGGAVGAIVAAIAAIGTSLALPGLGLIIAGPIAAALAGAGAGGATGGLVGALIGAGLSENEAAEYEKALREGGIILGFNPRNEAEANEVRKVWESYNGEMIYSY